METFSITQSRSEGSQVAGPSRIVSEGSIQELGEPTALATIGEHPLQQTFHTNPLPRVPFDWNALATHKENYQFHSLILFENAISNPDQTLVSLATTRVELRSAMVREAGFVPRLQLVIDERRIIMEELLERINRVYALAKRRDNDAHEAAQKGLEKEGEDGGSVSKEREERE